MRGRSGEGTIDFKPFFDMVVGVLFILLILVAAQMFFAQWSPVTEDARKASAEQIRRARDEEAGRLIEDFAARLSAAGFTPAVDRVSLAVSVPMEELVAGSMEGRAAARYAAALLGAAACASAGTRARADCPSYAVMRLSGIAGTLHLAQAAASPAPASRIAALDLANRLFAAEPDLLALSSPAGMPLARTQFDVSALGPGARGAGRFGLTFVLADLPVAVQ